MTVDTVAHGFMDDYKQGFDNIYIPISWYKQVASLYKFEFTCFITVGYQ